MKGWAIVKEYAAPTGLKFYGGFGSTNMPRRRRWDERRRQNYFGMGVCREKPLTKIPESVFLNCMDDLIREILESDKEFQRLNGDKATIIIFQKPKWNDLINLSRQDLLDAGIATKSDISDFIKKVGEDGPKAFLDRSVFDFKIQFDGFGNKFILE